MNLAKRYDAAPGRLQQTGSIKSKWKPISSNDETVREWNPVSLDLYNEFAKRRQLEDTEAQVCWLCAQTGMHVADGRVLYHPGITT